MSIPNKAVCLLSGGLDSATCLALARREGYACYALSFDYGQRHKVELDAAARVAAAFGAERHMVARIGLEAFGGSALTADIAVPKGRSTAEMGARHTHHLRARAQHHLPFFRAGLGRSAGKLGHFHRRQRARLFGLSRIAVPNTSKPMSAWPIWPPRPAWKGARGSKSTRRCSQSEQGGDRRSWRTNSACRSALTHSCYDPGRTGEPCGQCDACLLRRKGFEEAGIEDR